VLTSIVLVWCLDPPHTPNSHRYSRWWTIWRCTTGRRMW